jgi:hypothetical protein
MNFAEAAKNTQKWTRTENGAVALNTTSDACLDLFGTIGALRTADDGRITSLFEEAYKEDPLLATKILFYARDIRGDEETKGLGERRTFRIILRYCALHHPEAIRPNIDLIGVYGRYDDLYELIGTRLEKDMWEVMKKQFEEDLDNMSKGNAVSLLAKWIKTADASSDRTRQLGILTAHKLGYSVYNFKRIVRALRKHIGVVEGLMSTGQWDKIKYPEVPSRAMLIYRNAFRRHDEERFNQFAQKAVTGEEKINSATLFPYDLIERFIDNWNWRVKVKGTEEQILQAQWDQLPNYVEPGTNAIVMADTSASMTGRPICTALGLAIYFAQRNTGVYKDLFMTFSNRPTYKKIKGKTLRQIFSNLNYNGWEMNTDCEAAFKLILKTAVENDVPAEEMPKSLIIISDMEFDHCGNKRWTFYDKMKAKFAKHGYEIPTIIFWNVNSRNDVFHADKNKKGVILVSGQSTGTFKNLIGSIGMTPMDFLRKTICSKRYEPITVG